MEAPENEFSSSNWFLLRLKGWHIWYFQNLLLLIFGVLLIPFGILLFVAHLLGVYLGNILDMFYAIALVLDLVAVTSISVSVIVEGYQKKIFVIGGSGLLWVFFTLLWRVPKFLQEPIGVDLQETTAELTSSSLYQQSIFMLIGSIFLLLFLVQIKNQSTSKGNLLGTKTVYYGIINCLSCILLFYASMDGGRTYGFFAILFGGYFLKLLVLPFLGMKFTRIFIAITDTKPFYPTVLPVQATKKQRPVVQEEVSKTYRCMNCDNENSKKVLKCKYCGFYHSDFPVTLKTDEESQKRITKITTKEKPKSSYRSIRLLPPIRTISLSLILFILLLVSPVSPFFLENNLPDYDSNVHINRFAETPEAESVMQYIEQLQLDELTGDDFRYGQRLVDNSTLNYFLGKVNEAREDIWGKPPNIEFVWNMSVESVQEILNLTTFLRFWDSMKKIDEYHTDEAYLTWWDNQTQYEQEDGYDWDFTESPFKYFSHPVTWICSGSFRWYYSQFYSWKTVANQLIFLDSELNIVCLAYKSFSFP